MFTVLCFIKVEINTINFQEIGHPNLSVELMRALKTGAQRPYLHQGAACMERTDHSAFMLLCTTMNLMALPQY